MLEEDHSRSHLYTVQSAVSVPFLQSAATGLFTALAVGGLAVVFHVRLTLVVLAGAGIAASVCWILLLLHWIRQTTPTPPVVVEDWHDAPPAEIPCIRVEVRQERSMQFIDLPCDTAQLAQLAAGVLDGVPLAESAWTGRGRPFSRGQFSELRQVLLTRGLAVWRNEDAPAQGVTLTAAGRAVLRHCLETPLLLESDRTHE